MKKYTLRMTNSQHHELKTLSAYAGLSIKEFILSRIFAEAAETVFTPRRKQKTSIKKQRHLQKECFDESQIIVVSGEEWSKIQEKLAS